MQSRLHLGGHAVQPLLLMFPLGLFAMALFFDVATQLGAPNLIGTLAYWNIVAGLVGGLTAALADGYDALCARQVDAARARFLRFLLDLGVLVFFAVLATVRLRTQDRGADTGLLVLELFGLVAAVVNAWYSGRLDANRSAGLEPHESDPADDAIWIPAA
jgi:uncharacterized membrane protein